MPETLPGSLLKYKAMAWRRLTLNENGMEGGEKGMRWKAEIEDESFGVALQRNLKRPFIMLVKEPILAFFSIYLTGEFPPCLNSTTFHFLSSLPLAAPIPLLAVARYLHSSARSAR